MPLVLDDGIGQLLRVVVFPHDADAPPHPVVLDLPARKRQVLRSHGVLDVLKADLQALHLTHVHGNLDLPVLNTLQIYLAHPVDVLQFVLHRLRVAAQLLRRVVTRHVDGDDGELTQVDLQHGRFRIQVVGQFRLGLVHGVFRPLQRLVEILVGVELHRDDREVGHAGGLDHLQPVHALQFLLDGPRHETLDVGRRVTEVGRVDVHLRQFHLGKLLLGYLVVGKEAEEQDHDGDEEDRRPVVHGEVRQAEGSFVGVFHLLAVLEGKSLGVFGHVRIWGRQDSQEGAVTRQPPKLPSVANYPKVIFCPSVNPRPPAVMIRSPTVSPLVTTARLS